MAYHNCGLCVGESEEQRQIKTHGFTNQKLHGILDGERKKAEK